MHNCWAKAESPPASYRAELVQVSGRPACPPGRHYKAAQTWADQEEDKEINEGLRLNMAKGLVKEVKLTFMEKTNFSDDEENDDRKAAGRGPIPQPSYTKISL